MDAKGEGAVLQQVPLGRLHAGDALRPRGRGLRETSPPRCAMCGGRMVASRSHGLCPSCGYLAAPSFECQCR
jgi:hypothetical protein